MHTYMRREYAGMRVCEKQGTRGNLTHDAGRRRAVCIFAAGKMQDSRRHTWPTSCRATRGARVMAEGHCNHLEDAWYLAFLLE
jgi:hypothetical protein